MSYAFAQTPQRFAVAAALLMVSLWLAPSFAQDSAILATETQTTDARDGLEKAPLETFEIVEPLELAQPLESVEIVETVEATEIVLPEEPSVAFGDWLGYNATQSDMTWLSGGDFGMFSVESFPTLEIGNTSALLMGVGFHFLNGPVAPDLPPRLFDFQTAYHVRKALSEQTMLDVKLGVGAFGDFEGSARKGVRFPGHLVAYKDLNPRYVTVLGVEVLDRDDITLLPVGGLVWKPHDDLVLELVFPRPKVQLQLDDSSAMYIGGELGGGTWAIERGNAVDDNLTYRDLRILWGVMRFSKASDSVLEVGWAFDRSLAFRSHQGDRDLGGAFLLRSITHY